MRKIVVNRCHGGFGLSHAGVLAYARHKGITLYPEHDGKPYGFWTYWLVPTDKRPPDQDNWHEMTLEERQASNAAWDAASLTPSDIARDDPALVAAVEELGVEANGDFAKLDVTPIPADVSWHIEEYDGREWIAESHRTW
ncbi:hypothetical protein ACTJI5_09695 [Sphingopyxis sp. 22461]